MLSRMNFSLYCNYRGFLLLWQLGFMLVSSIFFIVTSYTRISPLCSNPFCSRGFGVGFGCLNTESHRVFGAVGPFKGVSLVGTHQLLCGNDLHGRFCHWACRFYVLHASYALSWFLGGGFKRFLVHPCLGKWSNLTSIFFKRVEGTN